MLYDEYTQAYTLKDKTSYYGKWYHYISTCEVYGSTKVYMKYTEARKYISYAEEFWQIILATK